MNNRQIFKGEDTIRALLEGKTLKHNRTGYMYKLDGGKLQGKIANKEWSSPFILVDLLLSEEFTEVATPQVGDWVRVTTELGNKRTGQVTEASNSRVWATWDDNHLNSPIELNYPGRTYEILSSEQISEHKRELAFSKVGRKLNEFRSGDIVCINVDGGVSIVVSNNNEETVRVHMLNVPGKGYTAKPHQLKPICFVENQVDLS